MGTTVDTGLYYFHTRAYYVTEHKSVGCQTFGEFKTLFKLEMCLSAWLPPLSRGISRAARGLPPLLTLTVSSMQSCTWGVLLGFDGHRVQSNSRIPAAFRGIQKWPEAFFKT